MRVSLLYLVILVLSDASTCRGFVSLFSTRNTIRLCDVANSLQILDVYNRDYLLRQREGRKEGLTPSQVEFRRVQSSADAIKKERAKLKSATQEIAEESVEVVMGIMAESGSAGIKALKSWVSGLGLERGILTAVDELSGKQIPIETLDNVPVYIKYNSTMGGDAYMKAYNGGNVGVTFQPRLKCDAASEFRQYGDLVLSLFR